MPPSMEPNYKSSQALSRSHSATRNFQEAMNELEGEERQGIKIEGYARADIKNHNLSPEKYKKRELAKTLKKVVAEQAMIIGRLQDEYEILETRLISQTDKIQQCKKIIGEEWDKREDKLRKQLNDKYNKKFKEYANERTKSVIKNRGQDINNYVMNMITD